MSRGFNQRPSPALVVALLALFVALGGGALAATSFIGSDGQIHGCVKKDKLTLIKPGKNCMKGTTAIAWNQRGPRGLRGIRGNRGVQGPGAVSFDGQFTIPAGGDDRRLPFNGFKFVPYCATTPSPRATVTVERIDGNHAFYAWGTKAEDGMLAHASAEGDLYGSTGAIEASGANSAELDVVAESTRPGDAVKWTRFDLSVVRGTKCNYHVLVTPSSSAG